MLLLRNRKARFNYDIKKTFLAGIILKGYEVKSVLSGGVSFADGYVRVESKEVWLINTSISKYRYANIKEYNPERKRKLLLNKNEIRELFVAQEIKKMSIIPLEFLIEKNKIKLKLGIGKGRKKYDKRKRIQERELKRQLKEEASI